METATTPLGASQHGTLDQLFLHSSQSEFDHLPTAGDTVMSVALGDHGHEIRFKSGRRIYTRGRVTETAARTIEQLIEKDGWTADGHAPSSVCEFSDRTIRRHRAMRRHAERLADKAKEDVDHVIRWAANEFRDAVIDEKTYPEIKAQIEEALSNALGFPVGLNMEFSAGTEPGDWHPEHPGFPPMYTYPEFLGPVFANRPQVDRSPTPARKLEGNELEVSIAKQMHELNDEFMFRDLDGSLIADLKAELCRILKPLAETIPTLAGHDLNGAILVRVAPSGDKPDVFYPDELRFAIDAVLNKWGDPRRTAAAGSTSAQQAPLPEQIEFEEKLSEKEVVLHEVSAIVGADGKGTEWRIKLPLVVDLKPCPEKPQHALVGYLAFPDDKEVRWQIVYESPAEVNDLVNAIITEVEREIVEKYGAHPGGAEVGAVAAAAGGIATAGEVAEGSQLVGGIDLDRPLEELAAEIPTDPSNG